MLTINPDLSRKIDFLNVFSGEKVYKIISRIKKNLLYSPLKVWYKRFPFS